MMDLRNATEFVAALRVIEDHYRKLYWELAEQRRVFASLASLTPAERDEHEVLEAHGRAFRIDGVLEALGWHVRSLAGNALPNVLPEAPLRSIEDGEVKFLDYLGYERPSRKPAEVATAVGPRPLLAVEAKRPSATLDHLVAVAGTQEPSGLSPAIARLLRNRVPAGPFREWLTQVSDYVRTIEAHAPDSLRRLVLTNGDWFIVFQEPARLFVGAAAPDPDSILVFTSFADVMRRAGEMLNALGHDSVLGEVPQIRPEEVGAFVDPASVKYVIRGVRVVYQANPNAFLQFVPQVRVAPTIFIQTAAGTCVRVAIPPADFTVPERQHRRAHFRDVKRASDRLLEDVFEQLGRSWPIRTVAAHYGDRLAFGALPGVSPASIDVRAELFFVITGERTHFLRERPSVPSCPYHSWSKADREGRAHGDGAVARPSVSPRVFFVSGEPHHCSRSDVFAMKRQPLTEANAARTGARSGGAEHAFCELWALDSMVCCRTCCFEEACTRCGVFTLPCGRARRRSPAAAASRGRTALARGRPAGVRRRVGARRGRR